MPCLIVWPVRFGLSSLRSRRLRNRGRHVGLELIRDGRHYDALKAQNDVAFYLAQAQAPSGPVLEVGCGTGRVTIPLAAAGVDITSLDVSASMLQEAKAESQGLRIDWVAADGRSFDLGRRFALIMMPFNTLQFFRDSAALGQLFRCVKSHLGNEGRFVFDVFSPQPASVFFRGRPVGPL